MKRFIAVFFVALFIIQGLMFICKRPDEIVQSLRFDDGRQPD